MKSRFPLYPLAELSGLPDDVAASILKIQEKSGFVPNVFLMLARRPAEFRAFFDYHDAIMYRSESSLTKGEREMVITTISADNHCLYCVVSHGAILRVYEKNPIVADQVAVNYRHADITPRQRAILDFAVKVNKSAWEIADSDFESLHHYGLDDEDAWDIAAITALFGLSNRMATVGKLEPNLEFYILGRTPRD
ncbi:peroxidase-related enzyme [Rhodococcus jostii]|uniref:peroxidase-related enzyme n=1 Tax=Rhodococcus jostii TaxID=132919 RepID=UPI003659E682